MNMQAIMKQAQAMQKDMIKIRDEVEKKEFTGESNFVSVKINGKKEVLEVKIDTDHVDKDDMDMLQDMIVVALNQAIKKVDDVMEKKMGKFGSIPGLF
ncbi:MAG: YbaB/EbfC family nucleoid-associated protein [Bacilli bacterium]|mgnify:CR=1 FL=1|nr:YbaB/EbfC family nucleoid-associated protein [Bacilli bacterium]